MERYGAGTRSQRVGDARSLLAIALSAALAGCVTVTSVSPAPSPSAPPIASATAVASATPSEVPPAPSATPTPSGQPPLGGIIKLGIELPLSGDDGDLGNPIANAVRLAVKQAKERGALPGFTLLFNVTDDATNGTHDPVRGAENMSGIVDDTAVLGVVGPMNSSVARTEIPISNEAGLAQCGTGPQASDLTLDGSDAYRFHGQDERNFFRVTAPDVAEGAAMAEFAFYHLNVRSTYVLDDDTNFGFAVADGFSKRFTALGGEIAGSDYVPFGKKDYKSYFKRAKALNPDAVFFGVANPANAASARVVMVDVGMGSVTFLGPDSVADLLPGNYEGSFISAVGRADAGGTYGVLPGIFKVPVGDPFGEDYFNEFGEDYGAFSPEGYVCAQVVIAAIEATAGEAHGDLAAWRELVRAYMFDETVQHNFETLIGKVSFNADGDLTAPPFGFWSVDPVGAGGAGDWVYVEQRFVEP